MDISKRRQYIKNLLIKNGVVDIKQLSIDVNVSEMTIRRDLNYFQKSGFVSMKYGGAYLTTGNNIVKTGIDYICAKILKIIPDNSVIYVDSQPFATYLSCNLKNKNLTVITNSLGILNTLSLCSNIRLHCVPGEYDKNVNSFCDTMSIRFIKEFIFDYSIITATKIVSYFGATSDNFSLSQLKSHVIDNSEKNIILCDSSLEEKNNIAIFAPFNKINYVGNIPVISDKLKMNFNQFGITVIENDN